MKLQASWIQDGSIELQEMPIAGVREVKAIDMKVSEIISLQTKLRFISFGMGLMAAQRILKSLGAKKAKESWDDFNTAELGAVAEFTWPDDQFEANLNANAEKFLLQNLGCATYEEAAETLKKRELEAAEAIKAVKQADIEAIAQRPLLMLYWRLRASGAKSIILPTGHEMFDWRPEAKEATMSKLAEVVTQTQLKSLEEERNRPFDMKEDLAVLEPSDVEGKSESPSASSTSRKPVSAPSSIPTTATIAA